MELTKAEMEDIWHNKPVNYLKVLKGKLKGTKKYDVTVQAYSMQKHEKVNITVISTSKSAAEWKAREEYRKMFPDLVFDGFYSFSVYESKR